MSEQQQQENAAPRITDKRGQPKPVTDVHTEQEIAEAKMPTAEELLEQPSTFEQQAQQNDTWENLSDDEKQAILAQQAAELEGTPFAGGGIKVEGETKREILAAFVIAIDLDGTATAMPVELFEQTPVEIQRDVTPRMMYRSCAEVMMDIEGAETAHLTLQMFKTVGDHMAQAQRAQALNQQLASRGGVRGKRR